MSDFIKRGTVKRTIKYTTKDGEEKNRYITVGEFWSTDGGNHQSVKLYATLNTDEVWLNIYPLEENTMSQNVEKITEVIGDENINDLLNNVPF